jgi:hypothetical protein
MAAPNTGQERVRRARQRLEDWKFDARDRAYSELFEGADAALTDEELHLLDRIDSDMARRGGSGLWGADEYGIVGTGVLEAEEPRVVCTYHPEIPYEGFRGEESLSEPTREEFNDVLWDYCERVAAIIQEELDAFLGRTRTEES